MNVARLSDRIKAAEGFRSKLYNCPAGHLTIGYGHNIEEHGISQHVAEVIFRGDLQISIEETEAEWVEIWPTLSDARQEVLVDMMFNMGKPTFNRRRWPKFTAALAAHDYVEAEAQMIDSKWHRDVKTRALELERLMREG